MTISFQLDATSQVALQEEAAAVGVTPEQLAADIVKRHLLARSPSDDPFRTALSASIQENDELLQRLVAR